MTQMYHFFLTCFAGEKSKLAGLFLSGGSSKESISLLFLAYNEYVFRIRKVLIEKIKNKRNENKKCGTDRRLPGPVSKSKPPSHLLQSLVRNEEPELGPDPRGAVVSAGKQ